MCSVAANIINKQWWTAKTRLLSIFGVGLQKTRMMHNITAQFGHKWILWNDLSNGKWYIKLGNTANGNGKVKARICGSTLGQMGQSLHRCLMERGMQFAKRGRNCLCIGESRVFGFVYIYIFMLPTANFM